MDYDALVGSGRDALAPVLRFLGAEWDDAVLGSGDPHTVVRSASVWQARQPVHARSVDRWRHYESQAPEFFARLAEIDAGHEPERIKNRG